MFVQVPAADVCVPGAALAQGVQPDLGGGRDHGAALLLHAAQEVHYQPHQQGPPRRLQAGAVPHASEMLLVWEASPSIMWL